MVVKIHIDGEGRRWLIVRGRNLPLPGGDGGEEPYAFDWWDWA